MRIYEVYDSDYDYYKVKSVTEYKEKAIEKIKKHEYECNIWENGVEIGHIDTKTLEEVIYE